jgi:DNA-binding CsgD family transcriptional regulator
VTGSTRFEVPGPDDTDACRGLLAEAADRFREGELRASAELALRASEIGVRLGRPDLLAEAALVVDGVPDPATAAAVERMARDALTRLDERDLAGTARLRAQLATALHHRDRLEDGASEAARALALAEEADDPLALAGALHAVALSIAGHDRGPALLALGDRLLATAAASRSVHAELFGRSWRVEALLRLGDTPSTGHEIDSLDVLAARTGEPLVRWNALVARAGLNHAVGRFADAEEAAHAARRAMPSGQRHQTEPLFVAQVMLVAIDRGTEPPEIEVARNVAVGGPLIALAMTGRYDLEVGDRTGALAAFEAVRPRRGDIALDRRGLVTLTALAELAVAFGEVELADELAGRLAAFDGSMIASSLGAVGPIAYFLSLVDGLIGRRDEAVAHADAAAQITARGGFGPWNARARLRVAEALAARGRPGYAAPARDAAELAVAAARRLGMTRLEERGRNLIERLDAPRRLSMREIQIAEYVASGASNREVAGALGLSERTVETHVQNIMTKLDFRSRVQIAGWAAERGLAARQPGGDSIT